MGTITRSPVKKSTVENEHAPKNTVGKCCTSVVKNAKNIFNKFSGLVPFSKNNTITSPNVIESSLQQTSAEGAESNGFDTLDSNKLTESLKKLGVAVDNIQEALAELFTKIALEKNLNFFVQGQLPSAQDGIIDSKSAGFNFKFAPKVGDEVILDGGHGLYQLQSEKGDAVNCSTADGRIPFISAKLSKENSIAKDIKSNAGVLTYLQKLPLKEDYQRLSGNLLNENAIVPLTKNMHLYRFYASNYPQGSPLLKTQLNKGMTTKDYFLKLSDQIRTITNNWPDENKTSDPIDFLRKIYDQDKSPIYQGSWTPGDKDKYPDTQSPKEIIELLLALKSEERFSVDNDEQMFALTILQAQVESYSTFSKMLETPLLPTQEKYEGFTQAVTSTSSLVLNESPTTIAMFDTVPAFKLFNQAIKQEGLELDRNKWVNIFVEIGVDQFIKATTDKGTFISAWKAVFSDETDESIESQWDAFQSVDVNNLTIIQDAPHDHDDQIAVAMAMSLKLNGKISNLSIVEAARNLEAPAHGLKTEFPRVYIDLCPNAMKQLRESEGFRLLTMYPEKGLPFYDSESKMMPCPEKPSHHSMNDISDDEVAKYKVEQFTLDDFVENGTLLVIAPFSIVNAVIATNSMTNEGN